MQINALTKTFTMLLVGLLAALAPALAFFAEFLTVAPGSGAKVPAAVVALLLMPVAILLGALIDALADLAPRRWMQAGGSERLAKGLCQGALWNNHADYKAAFTGLLAQTRPYAALSKEIVAARCGRDPEASYDPPSQLASAMFLRSASKENFDWVTSHYATYYLATSLCWVLAWSWLCFVFSGYPGLWARPLASIAAWADLAAAVGVVAVVGCAVAGGIWLLMSLALDRFLYTHVCLYREGILTLAEAKAAAEAETPTPGLITR